MKASVLAAILGSATAVKLNDAPAFFNEPTWGQNWPSAAGLLQISACEQFNGAGVSCGPSDIQLFATGNTGDEDLGQDITMKGQKFHYAQGEDNKNATKPANSALFATGMNGDEDLQQDITMKGQKFHYAQAK